MPISNPRPAQQTCEQCHWPQKFVGNLERTYNHFLKDETNTPYTLRMLLKVGEGKISIAMTVIRGVTNELAIHSQKHALKG